MISFLKKQVRKFIEYRWNIKARHLLACRDLNSKYMNATKPLTKDQVDKVTKFWGQYIKNKYAKNSFNIKWFDIYNSVNFNDNRLEYYIPDDFYYCFVDAYYSNPQAAKVVDNKNMYDMFFNDIKQPKTIARKINGLYMNPKYEIISEDKLIELCLKAENIIIKKSINSVGGKGIEFWDKNDSIDELKKYITNISDFVIQEIIKQHQDISRINESSINTIRIVTFIYNDKINVLSSILRMGVNGMRVDNASSGGIACGINKSGRLNRYATDIKAKVHFKHPSSGIDFEEIVIPNFDKCIALVKKLAPRFYNISKLISWDLSVGIDGEPILIEVNLTYGDLSIHQTTNGPIFGDMTEEILHDVTKNSYFISQN